MTPAFTRTERQRAIEFFAEHADYAIPAGRMARARDLANAEAGAKHHGWYFEWEADDEALDMLGDHEMWCPRAARGEAHEHEVLGCVLRDADAGLLTALWGIIDPTPEYSRVVEAELAQEALAEARHNAAKYLAWGAGSEGFSLVTVDQIRREYENTYYSGDQTWATYALVQLGTAPLLENLLREGKQVSAEPVVIEPVGDREVDDDDYIHQEFRIMTGKDGREIERFTTRIDGRA